MNRMKKQKHTVMVPIDLDAAINQIRIDRLDKEKTYPDFSEILIELAYIGLNGKSPDKIVSKSSKDTFPKQQSDKYDF